MQAMRKGDVSLWDLRYLAHWDISGLFADAIHIQLLCMGRKSVAFVPRQSLSKTRWCDRTTAGTVVPAFD